MASSYTVNQNYLQFLICKLPGLYYDTLGRKTIWEFLTINNSISYEKFKEITSKIPKRIFSYVLALHPDLYDRVYSTKICLRTWRYILKKNLSINHFYQECLKWKGLEKQMSTKSIKLYLSVLRPYTGDRCMYRSYKGIDIQELNGLPYMASLECIKPTIIRKIYGFALWHHQDVKKGKFRDIYYDIHMVEKQEGSHYQFPELTYSNEIKELYKNHLTKTYSFCPTYAIGDLIAPSIQISGINGFHYNDTHRKAHQQDLIVRRRMFLKRYLQENPRVRIPKFPTLTNCSSLDEFSKLDKYVRIKFKPNLYILSGIITIHQNVVLELGRIKMYII